MFSCAEQGVRGRPGHDAIPAREKVEIARPAIHGRRQEEAGGDHAGERGEGARARHPDEPRHEHERVGLDEHAHSDEDARRKRPPPLRRQCRAQQHDAEQQVRLAARESPSARNLPTSRRLSQISAAIGTAPIRHDRERQPDEPRRHPDAQREPHGLRQRFRKPREWRHRERERGKVLVLVVPVVETEERLGGDRACGRRAVHLEIDHLPAREAEGPRTQRCRGGS